MSERTIKKTPYLAAVLDEEDESPPLSANDAKVFRCCVGALLYLSVDLLECQCAIRAVSSYMTSPTTNATSALSYLVKYLRGAKDQRLLLQHERYGLRIDSYSDSDWATCPKVCVLRCCDFTPQVGPSLLLRFPQGKPNFLHLPAAYVMLCCSSVGCLP